MRKEDLQTEWGPEEAESGLPQASPFILDKWPHLSGLQGPEGKEKLLWVYQIDGVTCRESMTQVMEEWRCYTGNGKAAQRVAPAGRHLHPQAKETKGEGVACMC